MENRTPKSFALDAIKKGTSVIPVGKDKVPLISWKEFQERLPTKEEVENWYTKWPDANVGIVTGKISNLSIVDVEKGGDISPFPKTLTIKTGGGGWHLYYHYFPISNKARIFPLTDIRSDGGYVVAPTSTHASGKKYEVTGLNPISDFPYEIFGENKIEKKSFIPEVIYGVNEGNRNDSAAKICGFYLRSFPASEAWDLVHRWNKDNIPPLQEQELRNTFLSIKNREDKQKKGKKREYEESPLPVEDIDFIPYTKILEMGISELDATDAKEIISFGYDWLDEKLTGIFKGNLIVIGGESGTGKTTFATNIIYKASKNYKCGVIALEDRLEDYSISALYFEINRLRKIDNLNGYPWNAYRKNEIKDAKYLAYRNTAFKNLQNDNINFAKVKRQMTIETLERAIDKKVREGYKLFLVDHLHYFDLLRGDSSKADYIEKVMVRMKQLQNRTGARILLVVHYKKLEGRKPTLDSFKDSISIIQNANYVINLWRDRSQQDEFSDETEMYIPKARNPNGEATFKLRFDREKNDYVLLGRKYGTPVEHYPNEISVDDIPL